MEENTKKTIEEIFDNKEVIGVLLTGSYATELNTEKSDLDLRLLVEGSSNIKPSKIVKVINGIKVSYIQAKQEYYRRRILNEFEMNMKGESRIFAIGKIIMDDQNEIKELKNISEQIMRIPFDSISSDEMKMQYYILSEYYTFIKNNIESDTFPLVYFRYVYFCFDFYSKWLGFEDVYDLKLDRILFDKTYMKKNNFISFPDNLFIELWLDSINSTKNKFNYYSDRLFNYLTEKYFKEFNKTISLQNLRIKL